jgi:hypothetical protein
MRGQDECEDNFRESKFGDAFVRFFSPLSMKPVYVRYALNSVTQDWGRIRSRHLNPCCRS